MMRRPAVTSDTFNGARLETLRHIHGLTQRQLGERIGVTQSQLSRLERGDAPLSAELATVASEAFSEPLRFFQVPPSVATAGPVAFRRKAAMRAPERDRVTALYQEASRAFAHVSEASGYHEFVSDFGGRFDDPAGAAAAVRAEVGLTGEQPVRNVTRLLERLGIGVVSDLEADHDDESRGDVSGITVPFKHNRRPLVATLSIGRGDVQRLTIAHELGHLILDRNAPTVSCATRSPQEQAAFALGRALLMPPSVLTTRVSESSTLKQLLELKSEFGMSVGAIVYYANRIGAISDARARTLQIQIASRGWREREPVDVTPEKPMLLRQAMAKVYPAGTVARASHDLGIEPSRLRRWLGEDAVSVRDDVRTASNVTRMRFR